MSRNLVICCDGTGNQFGSENTNVVRLVQSIARDPQRQLVYYDPGVGTLPEPGAFTRLRKGLSEAAGLAFGVGIVDKVAGAYEYLMQTWQPGDRVYLFGFSRGAYTVRALAAALHMFGLLPAGNQNLVPYLMRQLKASRQVLAKGDDEFWTFSDQFRATFAREVPGRQDRRFGTHFLGVWDTVSSVGWVWDPVWFPYSSKNESVEIIRHAVSIDERRAFFRRKLFAKNVPGQDLKELWFAGVHSDIGGGYPKDRGALWRVAFTWMLDEASGAGLLIDEARRAMVLADTPAERAWAEPANESLTLAWWPAEIFPKLRWNVSLHRRLPYLNLGRRRTLGDDAVLHESVRQRIGDPTLDYAPINVGPALLRPPPAAQA